ncbi:hypothetical protein [Pandoraea cepalis]|uniref:Chromosome partition protein Smc n=1 Tax=Pandoraea cepalis TaxID=2508294 RepID=A0A5E4VW08_9BURK|nr:hypothetical protein [Pandoraea cepalis]VVE16013.1 Chromosome partition protein Smc [Pandoraea cepalis]
MNPSRLFLRGFAGILSGCRKSQLTLDLSVIPEWATLVALVGRNGQGKTTILDNLHPYRLMPSRCEGLKPSSFSYWDEIAEPLAQKQLDWSHNGVSYRSDLIFRVTGKTRNQQAFLHRWDGEGWAPVVLPDGTTSDGSAATYDRCIEAILGRPEVFFTTQFAAHRRRMLGDYEHADVKALLSAWLGHDELLRDSASAGEVASLLREKLAEVQARIRAGAELRSAANAARTEVQQLISQSRAKATALVQAQKDVQKLRVRIVQLDTEAAGFQRVDEQRKQWRELIETENRRTNVRVSELRDQAAKQIHSLRQSDAEANRSIKALQKEITDAETRLTTIDTRIAGEKTVREAVDQVAPLQTKRAALTGTLDGIRQQVSALRPYRTKTMTLTADLARVASEGTATGDRVTQLNTVAALADRVPCSGMELAAGCELLKDAREARAKLTKVTTDLANQRRQYATLNNELKSAGVEVAKLDALESQHGQVGQELDAVIRSLDRFVPLASQSPLIDEAKAARAGVVNLLTTKKADLERHHTTRNTIKADIDAATHACDTAIAQVQKAQQQAVAGYQERLQALPTSADASVREGVAKSLSQAEAQVLALNGEIAQLQAKQAQVHERVGRAEAGVAELGSLSQVAERLGQEIEAWELASQALGRDGLVAFSIDDAGPGIASIANDLLAVCYDGRFSVRFETQRELRSGAMREGFEIMVLDVEDGKEKPVQKLSGGQSVYINDCLMRAVALYLAGAAQFRSDTLFSDETDGLLDEEKKRQLILLKRRVLDLGKYSREYFVTQTKEIQGLADYVINVADL